MEHQFIIDLCEALSGLIKEARLTEFGGIRINEQIFRSRKIT
jgi:hypothetical protein